jgi:G:T/U-mismatch repair DNA glycosylase
MAQCILKKEMITVRHRFLDHQINPGTETLIIGTFNPETAANDADFFYGRSRNYLWRLLPTAYGELDLKGASNREKSDFIRKYKIDLTDLIEEIQVEEGQEANYDDSYIDSKVTRWRNIIGIIDSLPNLKRVCFTRKSLSGIPNIKKHLVAIQQHCGNKELHFKALNTPSRFYGEDKQTEWTNFLLHGSG